MFAKNAARPKYHFISGRLSEILDFDLDFWCTHRVGYLASSEKYVGSQLFSGIFVSAFYQPLSRTPEQPSGYAENDREERDDGFRVLVNELTETTAADFRHHQELGETFLKGLARFGVDNARLCRIEGL